jgi:hypothetical protein
MTRTGGRHHISRRTKIATLGGALAIAAGAVVVITTTGDQDAALADGADISQFVDITKVKANVKPAKQQGNATKGTFTVNCGKNENGHFNPDNFIAAPGVKNGAQHLHDYVGNLSTNADSNNKSLQKAGTTCKNGDKSAYFWPVVRIDTGEAEKAAEAAVIADAAAKDPAAPDPAAADAADAAAATAPPETASPPAKVEERKQQQAADKQDKAAPRVECPDVASKLDEVPDEAMPVVDKQLAEVEKVTADAEAKLPGSKAVDAEVLNPLTEQRKAALDQITLALGRPGRQPIDFGALAPCKIKDQNNPAPVDDGTQNSDKDPGTTKPGPEENANNELPGNDGVIQQPAKVELTFRGSPVGKVTAMPKFLRVLYGDAKISINGTKNARDSWTCSGFEDKVQLSKYVICPKGSKVKRIHDFPSCWDGKNTDSANHRTHIVFPDANGKCANGFKAVPQLRITLTYNIPLDIQKKGQYKVDSFPDEKHNPVSDHDDFANVMSQNIMNRLVNCINKGKTCKE